MNCLVIGYGSIGSRHAAVLNEMGHDVSVVSARFVHEHHRYGSIEEAFSDRSYDYVVIANRTCDHHSGLVEIMRIGFRGLVLVEKPLFDTCRSIPEKAFENVFVGYNLRCHPVLRDVYSLVQQKKIYSMHVYVGQYLPDWRPGTDYTSCYSAHRTQGGGVLRDLSHELDYVTWLAGDCVRVAALGGRFSDMPIKSDDTCCLLIETRNCPAITLQMNYLDRKSRRECIINLDNLSIKADLVNNRLEVGQKCTEYDVSKNYTYRKQHYDLLRGETNHLCTMSQGLAVMQLIRQAESANADREWKLL